MQAAWKQGSWGQHGAHLGPQDPDGPHVGPRNFAIWVAMVWAEADKATVV